jgi:hypothetical protein
MSERERRLAENEAYWRRVNELAPPDPGVGNAVFCECGKLECGGRVPMTEGEYREARVKSTTFVVAPGHELLEIELVVATTDRYLLVAKQGEAAAVAVRTDVS